MLRSQLSQNNISGAQSNDLGLPNFNQHNYNYEFNENHQNDKNKANYLSEDVIQRLNLLPNFTLFREILEKVTLNNILFSFLGNDCAENDENGRHNPTNINNQNTSKATVEYLFEQFYDKLKAKSPENILLGNKTKRLNEND